MDHSPQGIAVQVSSRLPWHLAYLFTFLCWVPVLQITIEKIVPLEDFGWFRRASFFLWCPGDAGRVHSCLDWSRPRLALRVSGSSHFLCPTGHATGKRNGASKAGICSLLVFSLAFHWLSEALFALSCLPWRSYVMPLAWKRTEVELVGHCARVVLTPKRQLRMILFWSPMCYGELSSNIVRYSYSNAIYKDALDPTIKETVVKVSCLLA